MYVCMYVCIYIYIYIHFNNLRFRESQHTSWFSAAWSAVRLKHGFIPFVSSEQLKCRLSK